VEEGGRDVAKRISELMDLASSRFGQENEKIRDLTSKAAYAFNAVQPGDRIQEFRRRDNYITLAAGDHGGIIITKPNTQVKSVGQARITNKVIIQENCVFAGLIFESDIANSTRNNADCLVDVQEGVAQFVGCTFIKNTGDPMNSSDTSFENFVMVQEGAKALFNGCTFHASEDTMKQTGDVVRNHTNNGIGDCIVGFSTNTTGQTNSNCTNVGVLT